MPLRITEKVPSKTGQKMGPRIFKNDPTGGDKEPLKNKGEAFEAKPGPDGKEGDIKGKVEGQKKQTHPRYITEPENRREEK